MTPPPPTPNPTPKADSGAGDASEKPVTTNGVWFVSSASGLMYRSQKSAGNVAAVVVNGFYFYPKSVAASTPAATQGEGVVVPREVLEDILNTLDLVGGTTSAVILRSYLTPSSTLSAVSPTQPESEVKSCAKTEPASTSSQPQKKPESQTHSCETAKPSASNAAPPQSDPALAAAEWRPMETAPKDGSTVEFKTHSGNEMALYWSDHYSIHGLGGCWTDSDGCTMSDFDFVGWRPLAPALDYHNPDSLPSPGEAPWRFLVKGEEAQNGDEAWDGSDWFTVRGKLQIKTEASWTYRTRRPLPLAPAPAPEGRGETAECDALELKSRNWTWIYTAEAFMELAKRLERERDEARAALLAADSALEEAGINMDLAAELAEETSPPQCPVVFGIGQLADARAANKEMGDQLERLADFVKVKGTAVQVVDRVIELLRIL